MWIPPWVHRSAALGAYGPRQVIARSSDMAVIGLTRAKVLDNIARGRPFYENIPKEFKDRFQQNARGIWNTILHSQRFMIQGYDADERKDQATRIVNKTYYNALRALGSDAATFRGEASFATWIYSIAYHAMIDDLRMYLRSPEGKRREEEWKNRATSDKEARTEATFEASEAGAAATQVASALELRDERGNPIISGPDVRVIRAAEKAAGDFVEMGKLLGTDAATAEKKFIQASKRAQQAVKDFYSKRSSTTVSSKERVRLSLEEAKRRLEELKKS